ncbi:MAG TPA: nuclear transport factor 2 family protein [Vicinamibacterales bacterium]|nr:nuclear transport factor 2 family protein [Vicinamibacterales bacterium]
MFKKLMFSLIAFGVAASAVSLIPGRANAAGATTQPALTPMDYIQIQQLVRKYGWALDSGENYGYAYADLYTPDGIFVGTNQGPTGRTYQGREALAALARGGSRGPLFLSHVGMNHVITPTPDGGAIGKNYVAILDVGLVGRPNGVSHGGQYDDVYEKTSVGWRFKKRVYWESKVDTKFLRAPAAR